MKIAILSHINRLGGYTGDMVQARKTTDAMLDLGHDVVRCYLDPSNGVVFDENRNRIGLWSEALGDRDVVHAIPPIPWKFLARLPKIKAKLVCSTVFWRSKTYTKVLHRARGKICLPLTKDYLRTFLAWLGVPTFNVFEGYDLLLPNSEDELRNVRRYCKIGNHTRMIAVPNAIDPIPDYVNDLQRPSDLPKEDYVLVPGVFAERKNQLAFIRAVKGLPYTFVFMGDGPTLDRCKKEASNNMLFLGYVEHGSEKFYGVLKYARVACLPSNCETPGIAGLEAAALGARPVIPYEGGTCQYYGWDAEYIDPLSKESMRVAILTAWNRGGLSVDKRMAYRGLTWDVCAKATLCAYATII